MLIILLRSGRSIFGLVDANHFSVEDRCAFIFKMAVISISGFQIMLFIVLLLSFNGAYSSQYRQQISDDAYNEQRISEESKIKM